MLFVDLIEDERAAPKQLFAFCQATKKIGKHLATFWQQPSAAELMKCAARRCDPATNCRRQTSEVTPDVIVEVKVAAIVSITTKQFVRAFSKLHNFCAGLARKLRHVIQRNANRIGDWFILMKNQIGQEVEQLLLADHY